MYQRGLVARPDYSLARAYARRNPLISGAAALGAAATAGKVLYNNFVKKSVSNVAAVPSTVIKTPKRIKKAKRTKKKSLKKTVREIQKEIKSEQANLIYRSCVTGRVLSSVNQSTVSSVNSVGCTELEAVLGQLRFFDSATPGTLIQASGATGTYMREYHFKNISSSIKLVNNYQVPVEVQMFVCSPKEDTSIPPATAFTNGLADVGNPSSTSRLVFVTDSSEFNHLWSIKLSKKARLEPGQSLNSIYSIKDCFYDPSVFDSHALEYQRKFKNYSIMIRVSGVLGHDTSLDQQGHLQAGIDYSIKTTYNVEYDAGIDLKFIVVNDLSDSFTNGGVVSEQPIADNIGYSVA